MATLLQDLRYGIRGLARNPGFAAAAIATLALGVGANTAIFSLVNAVLVRPIPGISDPGRVVWITHAERGQARRVSYPDVLDYRARTDVFSGVAAIDDAPAHVSARGEVERITVQVAGGDFFDVLGVVPALGRTFTPA